jgi:hypothetical protein
MSASANHWIVGIGDSCAWAMRLIGRLRCDRAKARREAKAARAAVVVYRQRESEVAAAIGLDGLEYNAADVRDRFAVMKAKLAAAPKRYVVFAGYDEARRDGGMPALGNATYDDLDRAVQRGTDALLNDAEWWNVLDVVEMRVVAAGRRR